MLAAMTDALASQAPIQRSAKIRFLLHAAQKRARLQNAPAGCIAIPTDGHGMLGHSDDFPLEKRVRNDLHQSRSVRASCWRSISSIRVKAPAVRSSRLPMGSQRSSGRARRRCTSASINA